MRTWTRFRTALVAVAALSGVATSCFPETTPPPPDPPDCPVGASCTPATTTDGSTSLSVQFGPGATSANLSISINPPDAPAFECPTYPKPSGAPITEFHFTDGTGDDRLGFMSTTVADTGAPIEVCWAAPYAFQAAPGTLQIQGTKPGTGDPLYVGLLRWCDANDWNSALYPVPPNGHDPSTYGEDGVWWTDGPPCIWDVTYSQFEDITVTVLTTGADPWRY